MQGARLLTLAPGKAFGGQDHDPPGAVINAARSRAIAGVTGKQPRCAGECDDEHKAAIALAIAVDADPRRTRRIALDGEIGKIDGRGKRGRPQVEIGGLDRCFEKTGQLVEHACPRGRKTDLEIL